MGGRGADTGGRNSFRELGEYDSARKYFEKSAKKWEESLTDKEIDAITQYTAGDEGTYDMINNYLWSGGSKTWKTQADLIDKAISKFDLPENIMVYRGTEGADLDLTKGSIINLKGFTSTSTDPEVAMAYANNDIDWQYEKPVVLQISVPKGRGRGAYTAGYAMAPDESEVLLNRNSRIQVTGTRRRGGTTIVTAKLL